MAISHDILDSIEVIIAVLDADGTIVFVNRAWKAFADANATALGPAARANVGSNYLAVADASAAAGSEDARLAAAGLRSILERRPNDSPLSTTAIPQPSSDGSSSA
jgi:hypothetical protein